MSKRLSIGVLVILQVRVRIFALKFCSTCFGALLCCPAFSFVSGQLGGSIDTAACIAAEVIGV